MTRGVTPAAAPEWSVDPDVPERDGRVEWLIREIGGSNALAHRHGDILRERFGRSRPEGGRRIDQLIENKITEAGLDSGQPEPLQHIDADRVWRGLLATATNNFSTTTFQC
jgi:hypothetical protein